MSKGDAFQELQDEVEQLMKTAVVTLKDIMKNAEDDRARNVAAATAIELWKTSHGIVPAAGASGKGASGPAGGVNINVLQLKQTLTNVSGAMRTMPGGQAVAREIDQAMEDAVEVVTSLPAPASTVDPSAVGAPEPQVPVASYVVGSQAEREPVVMRPARLPGGRLLTGEDLAAMMNTSLTPEERESLRGSGRPSWFPQDEPDAENEETDD